MRQRVGALTARFPLYAWKRAREIEPRSNAAAHRHRRPRASGISASARISAAWSTRWARIDHVNRYTLVTGPADARTLAGLPHNFRSAIYARTDRRALDNLPFPVFLRGLSPDLVHIPLNRVPLLMIRPYVVTIHDMANLLFPEDGSSLRMQLRRYRFRRGLERASPRNRRLRRHPARRGEPHGRAAQPHPPGL